MRQPWGVCHVAGSGWSAEIDAISTSWMWSVVECNRVQVSQFNRDGGAGSNDDSDLTLTPCPGIAVLASFVCCGRRRSIAIRRRGHGFVRRDWLTWAPPRAVSAPMSSVDGLFRRSMGFASTGVSAASSCSWPPTRAGARDRHQSDAYASARVTTPETSELILSTHCCRRRVFRRVAGLPWNLTFARAAEEFSDGDSGRSQVASIDRE
jgi:hypothetical protein